MNEVDRKRLIEAVRSYGAMTGKVVCTNWKNPDIEELKKNPEIVQALTTMMADIYRKEIRESIFGWEYSQ